MGRVEGSIPLMQNCCNIQWHHQHQIETTDFRPLPVGPSLAWSCRASSFEASTRIRKEVQLEKAESNRTYNHTLTEPGISIELVPGSAICWMTTFSFWCGWFSELWNPHEIGLVEGHYCSPPHHHWDSPHLGAWVSTWVKIKWCAQGSWWMLILIENKILTDIWFQNEVPSNWHLIPESNMHFRLPSPQAWLQELCTTWCNWYTCSDWLCSDFVLILFWFCSFTMQLRHVRHECSWK